MAAVQAALEQWLALAAPEKAYVLTDKDAYLAGETVWVSGFVLDGVTNELGTPSGAVFVDIVDVWGKSWMAKMGQLRFGRTEMQIELPTNLPPGDYQLRASTLRMRNYDEGYAFRRSIRVLNPSQPKHGPTYIVVGDSLHVEMLMEDAEEGLLKGRKVEVGMVGSLTDGAAREQRTDSNGLLRFAVAFDSLDWEQADPQITLQWRAGGHDHDLFFRIPDLRAGPAIRFFPEGGAMVDRLPSRVAFEVSGVGPAQLPMKIFLKDGHGRMLDSTSTVWRGFGSFNMTPLHGQNYYAEYELLGQRHRATLPEVREAGASLRAGLSDAGLELEVRHTGAAQPLIVAVHRRGLLVWAAQSSEGRDILRGVVDPGKLGSGVLHVTVFDAGLNPLAERLVFVGGDLISVEGGAGGNVYGIRDEVDLRLALKASDAPAFPTVAVSVTESSGLASGSMDLASWLLLASDLRGMVENPGDYLFGDGRGHVDLLMLTHGWRRFRWDDLLAGKVDTLPAWNAGFELRGRVVDVGNRRGVANSQVVLLPGVGKPQVAHTDRNGYFVFTGVSYPDSTQLTLQADDLNGRRKVRIELDETVKPQNAARFLPSLERDVSVVDSVYVRSLRTRLAVDRQWGVELPAYTLGEVTVVDTPIRDKPPPSRLLTTPDKVIKIQEQPVVTGKVMSYLLRYPSGFRVREVLSPGGRLMYEIINPRASTFQCPNGCSPMILLDGVKVSFEEASLINASEVDVIEILKDPGAAIYGFDGFAGVISIVTRSGEAVERSNMEVTTGMGYAKAREFYSPDYGVQADLNRKPDLRSTLFWKPMAAADDAGVLRVRFFTGDRAGTWVLRVEGIDELGRPLALRQTFEVRNE